MVCIDSYSEIFRNGDSSLMYHFLEAGGSANGQSFKPHTYCYKLTKAEFHLAKTGDPTGTAHARLYAHTGTFGVDGYPTGPVLAVSDGFDVSTLTTSFTIRTFTFSGVQQYLMSKDVVYCIVYCNPEIGDGTINASNHVNFGYAGTIHTHEGIRCRLDGVVWDADWYWLSDAIFYVYGEITDCPLVSSCVDAIFKLYIDGNDPPTTERYYINIHYTKSHPNQDPDTFEIIVDPDVGSLINYFDRVKITKYNVTEFYGFVEEITPTVGEDGLEYRLTGRCWKLITWKKWTERYQESREIGPVDSEGNIETGFFGQVKPEELLKFVLRCPTSEHPKGKVRHKIGWGIPSDWWTCCASATADMFYPDWVGLRYTGLSWRGRASMENLHYTDLICNTFDSTYVDWTENGDSPYLDTQNDVDNIRIMTPPINQKEGYFGFDDLVGTAQTIYTAKLYVKANVQGYAQKVAVYLNDGVSNYKIGYLNLCVYGYGYTEFNCINILDTPTKVNAAKIYFNLEFGYHTIVTVIYAYIHVEYSTSTDDDISQKTNDWFVVNLGGDYDDVTAILIECRNNPTMYARNYNIQYAIISDCCAEGGNDGQWADFDPPINETNNDVRDILHSWKPQDDVHCIRIKLTGDANYPWEISQIYVWQSDTYKYRVLDEGD